MFGDSRPAKKPRCSKSRNRDWRGKERERERGVCRQCCSVRIVTVFRERTVQKKTDCRGSSAFGFCCFSSRIPLVLYLYTTKKFLLLPPLYYFYILFSSFFKKIKNKNSIAQIEKDSERYKSS